MKKSNNIIKLAITITALLAFTACSTNKKPTIYGTGNEVKTNGIGTQNGFDDYSFNDENSPNRLKAPYNQTYHFAFDKYEVKQQDLASIYAQANYLATHPNAKIRLEGNADERGSREYNIALGWKRARAVGDILQQEGVAPTQINMVSYGKEKPVAFGHDEASYRLNRRVDLIYEAK